jgi:hypothetical protein
MKSLYIDCEWYIGGKVFLIGACGSDARCTQLYSTTLAKDNFRKLLQPGTVIYFYGPDIGVLEKYFNIELRKRYICINLLTVFRQVLPPQESYKLADLERKFKIKRTRCEYKKNIFNIFHDWKSADKRKRILQYNKEDVVNLLKLKRIIFKKYKLKVGDLQRLQ